MEKISLPNYPSNDGSDNKSTTDYNKAAEKEDSSAVEPQIEGGAKKRKKGLGKKFAETFIADDAGSVGEYVIFDVLVPAMKDTLYDIVANTVSMFLFGGTTAGRRTGSTRRYNDYSAAYSVNRSRRAKSDPYDRDRLSSGVRGSLYCDDLEFESYQKARKVYDYMLDRLNEYPSVTVADFYHAAGVTVDWTWEKYGWYDLRGMQIQRGYGDKCYIIMPKAVYIED